jgi:hypothetical protein
MNAILKGIHKNLNKHIVNLFIIAKIITRKKKFSHLFSTSNKLLDSILAYNVPEFN